MKSHLNYPLFCSTLIAVALCGAAPVQAQQQVAANTPVRAQQASDTIPDIVVTASRREELNQTVPISITAFSSERMRQLNIAKPQDLQATVPSLVVGANGQGTRDSQTFTLRGQGATFQASPGVVVYMNEVPLPAPISLSQQGSAGNYLDLANLQVLAGPQGTLFGRNTTGGAVLLVPQKPTDKLEGSVSAKFGNYDTAEFEGMLNVPVVPDKLKIRAVGGYTDRDGYTNDITFKKKLDDTHWYSGRLGITFTPTDTLENYTMGYATHQSNNGTGLIHKGFNIAGLQAVGFCVDPPLTPPGPSFIAVSCDVYRGYTAQANALGPRATAPSVDQGQRTETWGVTNTTRLELNPDLAIRNIVSYQRFKSYYYYDGDGAPAQQYDSSIRSNTLPRDYLETITEELQAQGNALDKRLTYTVGGFFYDQKPAGPSGAQSVNYCPAAFTGFCAPNNLRSDVRNESKAIYVQASLDIGSFISLEGLKLTGGYRHTWDKITGNASLWGASTTTPGAFVCSHDSSVVTGDPVAGCRFAATLKSDAPNWTVGLDYQARQDLLLFAKVSKGYKAGGFNAYAVFPTTRTFTPEYVTSYETGFKSDIKIGNMPTRLNATAYYLNYSNIQKATGDFNPATRASGARINPASAHIYGIELDGTIRPFEWLELGGSFSHTDFKYTRYNIVSNGILPDCTGVVPPAGTNSDLRCLKGQYVAPYIYSLRGTITFPVPEEYGNISLFANYSHNSKQNTEALIVPAFQPGSVLEPFGILNGSLDWNNVYKSNIDIGLYATNITNKLYRISNSDVYQIGSLLSWATIYGEPRMFGARLRYHFGG
jgi:iron complex outermembrane receptor protein